MAKLPKVPEFDDLIQDQGSFGKFQVFTTIFLFMGINCVGWE